MNQGSCDGHRSIAVQERLMSLDESMEDLWATIRRHREDTEDIADICRYIQQDLDALMAA